MKTEGKTGTGLLAMTAHERWRLFNRALKRCRENFDTKEVHECRVEARRLLSTLDLIQSIAPQESYRKGRRPIRKCLKLLQPLRDLQMQAALTRRSRIVHVPLVRAELASQRRRHRKKAMRGIEDLKVNRAKALVAKMGKDLQRARFADVDTAALRRILIKRLAELYRTVIKLRRDIDPADVETIHRVRIAFKKLRYTIEPVRGFLTEFPADSMRDIKSLQEALGSLQDTDVFLGWLDKWIRKQPEIVRPLALFRHWLLCLRPQQIRLAVEWIDRLPPEWHAGRFEFLSDPSKQARNSASRTVANSTNEATRARSSAPDRRAAGPPRLARRRGPSRSAG
jgi:CHAD domain-containing protein